MKKYITYIIFLSLIEISAALYLTFWRELFWNYVEARNFHGFCIQIGVFTFVAFIFCLVNAYAGYFTTLCAVKWRESMNYRIHNIVNINGLRDKFKAREIENYNQRVQEDCRDYPDLFLQLVFGLGKSIVYVVVFSVSITINFNWVYLGIIVVYAIVSTLIAQRIAKPLVSLNYATQQAEATYRNNLTGLNFANCIQIMLGLALKTKRLSYFQTFYAQIAVVLPIVVVAPAYFGGALTLGALMQATGTMGTITDNLSFGITSFNIINKFKSCKRRLHEIGMFDK